MTSVPEAPGILSLHGETTGTNLIEDTVCNISNTIPAQTLTLRAYRAEFADAATAQAIGTLYVDLPFLSNNQLMDNNVGHVLLPLYLENLATTVQTSLTLPIYSPQQIPERFEMRVFKRDALGVFTLATDLVAFSLEFALQTGHIF